MIYNYISSKVCVARVIDKFNIKSGGWVNRVPEYVNSFMRALGSYYATIDTKEDGTVEEYKCFLPCDLHNLTVIIYEGYRLPRTDVVNQKYADDVATQVHSSESCELVPAGRGYIITTFEEGTVTFYYRKLPVEKERILNLYFPLIPDVEELFIALDWYIFERILQRGYIHPIYKIGAANPKLCVTSILYGDNGTKGAKQVARNSLISMDLESREQMSEVINTFIQDYNYLDRGLIRPANA